ncbi:WG repeat-containing protein, partial [Myxococcota bacterium]|nr:WG repeat-containing protein [Myxococcota bacterium]
SEGLSKVNVGEKWGCIDKTGKEVIKPQYDSVRPFSEGLAFVSDYDRKWGFIDRTGKKVIELKNKLKNPLDGLLSSFSEGLAAVTFGEKWGFIDKTGKEVIKPKYDNAWSFSEGLSAVKWGEKWGFIDKTGKCLKIKMAKPKVFVKTKKVPVTPKKKKKKPPKSFRKF